MPEPRAGVKRAGDKGNNSLPWSVGLVLVEITTALSPSGLTREPALGLDPRALHFANPPQVQSPWVKPKGDDRGWGKILPRTRCHPGLEPGPIPRSHHSRKVALPTHNARPTISGWIPGQARDDTVGVEPSCTYNKPADGKAHRPSPSDLLREPASGLDPRALHFANPPQVQSPRVKPEDDDRRYGTISPTHQPVPPPPRGRLGGGQCPPIYPPSPPGKSPCHHPPIPAQAARSRRTVGAGMPGEVEVASSPVVLG
jgi:hypothetical protein